MEQEKETIKLSLWNRLLSAIVPGYFTRMVIRKLGAKPSDVDLAEKLFEGKRVDIWPLVGVTSGRGFMLILDRHMSFWFLQEGDHYEFDGWEAGEYEKGEVTIFDSYLDKNRAC